MSEALHLSEGAAYKRITAARVARRFPVILEMLADGRLHLSAICLLAPHLTEENHRPLLNAAVHRSKRGIEMLLAEHFPKPDVPQSLRKLPAPPAQPQSRMTAPAPEPSLLTMRPVPTAPTEELSAAPVSTLVLAPPAPPPRPAVVVPLAPERFKLQLTISRKTRDRLDEARNLLGHQVPNGDLAEVVDRALDALVRELRKKKYAETEAPREPGPTKEGDRSKRIPNHVKRAVTKRDGHQCTFVAQNGQRCPARGRLELHHLDPQGKGGLSTVANVTLRCHVHNEHAAEMDYGAEYVAQRITAARERARSRVARQLSPGTAQMAGL